MALIDSDFLICETILKAFVYESAKILKWPRKIRPVVALWNKSVQPRGR